MRPVWFAKHCLNAFKGPTRYKMPQNSQETKPKQSHKEEKHPSTRFAHSSEQTFARILDYYEIEWEYEPKFAKWHAIREPITPEPRTATFLIIRFINEPKTFPLEWDVEGNVVEAFAPDFYLPDQDLYIELTTLRPQLTTRKNRKIRRMHELYPDVHIKLFKRRDLHNLMVKYGLDQEAKQITGTQAQNRQA